ncbi:MAG: S-layer homology domain-containing protein [Oscillospiraceae bacterium]|nr:S-layer homology domain-containing protein [Oscillospiraceae bacterium]
MKTLKKILSVVLVVAMLASMLIVGAAAAETEKTNYEEAAAVVIGLGIIEGDETGYNFQGELTREQAAKIVTYMLLGKSTAESLKVSAAPFADVAANRWSAPYIAYLKGQGIVSGVSATEFDPTAPVTGVQLAKMMLTAVGYNANGEFEGDVTSAWDINILAAANDNDVFEGTLTADLTAPATREEAMLYMFNTLTKVPVVKYNKTFESYYTGKSALDPVDTANFDAADETTAYGYTLAWTKYELIQTATGADDFGRPSVSWTADNVEIAEDVAVAVPDYVLYGGVNSATLYTTLGKAVVKNINDNAGAYNAVYENGDAVVMVWAEIKAGVTGTNAIASTGATTELYLDYEDGNYYLTAVVYYEQIGQVRKVDTTNNTMTINGAVAPVDGDVIDITGYEKGDWVVYTEGKYEVASVRPAESVVGEYTASSMFTGYTIGGVNYFFAEKFNTSASDATAGTIVTGTTYELYLDSQNNILMVKNYDGEDATNAYQYVYVNGIDCQAFAPTLIDGKDAAVVVSSVSIDGGAAVSNYALKYTAALGYYFTFDGAKYSVTADGYVKLNNTGAPIDITTLLANGWYTITTDENGAIALRSLATNSYANDVDGVTLVANRNTIASTGYTANSATVLTFVDAWGTTLSFTGIANFPVDNPVTAEDGVLILHGMDSTVAKEIVIYTGYAPVGATTTYGFVIMSMSSTTTTTTYMVYVDGVAQFITIEGALPTMGMYEVVVVENTAGVYTLTPVSTLTPDPAVTWTGGMFFAMTETNAIIWREEATIANVDDNFFQTVAIDAVAGSLVNPNGTEPADDWADTNVKVWHDYWESSMNAMSPGAGAAFADPGAYDVASATYYYDDDTIIYNCVTGGIATELNEGDCFMAKVVTDNAAWAGVNYCEYIWIVG